MKQPSDNLEIRLVDEEHVKQFSLIYTEAFRGKLKAFSSWSDEDLAQLLADTGVFENLPTVGNYMAVEDGQVVGCLVLHFLPEGSAKIPGGAKRFFTLCRKYGVKTIGGLLFVVTIFGSKHTNDELYIDALAVSSKVRSHGIGSQLIDFGHALAMKDPRVHTYTLRVIHSNPRAKALYERKGFVVVSSKTSKLTNYFLGVPGADRMAMPLFHKKQ